MYIYKTFVNSDKKLNSFKVYKRFNIDSYSTITSSGLTFTHTKYTSQSADNFSGTGSVIDFDNSKKYFQLESLFYKNYKLNHGNLYEDIYHLKTDRTLSTHLNVLSIPQQQYGEQIKRGSLLISGNLPNQTTFSDDTFGNLIDNSFTTGSDYFKEEKFRTFYLGPVEGHKLYDVRMANTLYSGIYTKYRRGRVIPDRIYYTSENNIDDSYYLNNIDYKDVTFVPLTIEEGEFPSIFFNGSTSYIRSRHNPSYNFASDFAISFYFSPKGIGDLEIGNTFTVGEENSKEYLISKSTTKFGIKTPKGKNEPQNTTETGSLKEEEIQAENTYPFEIYYEPADSLLYFKRDDGNKTTSVNITATSSKHPMHITCQKTGSNMEIYLNGIKEASTTDNTTSNVYNTANLYIGSKGNVSDYFMGALSQIMIFEDSLNQNQISNLSQSINNTPSVGNVFYSNGLITSTKPNYDGLFKSTSAAKRYYPLNSIYTSSLGNDTFKFAENFSYGSFLDLSTNQQTSSAYVNLPMGEVATNYTLKSSSQATFETVTHNNFTGELLLISSSISESVGRRGREYVKIPNYELQRGGKWAVSLLLKEAAGFHTTQSYFMGADLDTTTEEYPFNSVYHPRYGFDQADRLEVREKTGNTWTATTAETNRSESKHIVFNWDGSDLTSASLSFYVNGQLRGTETKDISNDSGSGSFNLEALGSGYNNGTSAGTHTFAYSGSIGQVMVFDHMLTTESIQHLNNNPLEGIYPVTNVQYNSTYTINENEYKCTVEAEEFNFTNNISVKSPKAKQNSTLADFSTGSLFKPYVTTIGLYNDNNELLVVGKLGQPIKMSDETDTTFVVRWDV